jgi:membrane protease YdiL (CAAX protease family)
MALGVTALLGGNTPQHWFSWPSLFLFAALAFGPWGEELGWRGFLQPRLQQRMGALGASVLVGAIWHFWHYGTSATPAGMPIMNIVLHFPSVVGPGLILNVTQSVLMAWLYNKTNSSLPIAWAFHAGIGLSNQVVAGTWPTSYYWQLTLYCVAVAVVILFNRQYFLSGSRSGSVRPPEVEGGNVEDQSIAP